MIFFLSFLMYPLRLESAVSGLPLRYYEKIDPAQILDSLFLCMINSARLRKANFMKGGARPMIMNTFYLTPAFTGKADVDSRSAPASR
jgi:hypothetical protein